MKTITLLLAICICIISSVNKGSANSINVIVEKCKADQIINISELYNVVEQLNIRDISPLEELMNCLEEKGKRDMSLAIYQSIERKCNLEGIQNKSSLIDLMIEIGFLLHKNNNPVKSHEYIDKLIDLEKYASVFQRARIYRLMCEVSTKGGDIEKAVFSIEKAISLIINKSEHVVELGRLYYDYADANFYKNEYNKAFVYIEKAINIFKLKKAHRELVDAYNIKSIFYRKKGEIHESIFCLQSALAIGSKNLDKNDPKVLVIKDRIANCYFANSEYNMAVKYYRSYMFDLKRRKIKEHYIPILYYKIGACYTNLKDFNRAETYIDSSLFLLQFDKRSLHPFEALASPVDMIMILYFKAKNFLKRYEVYGCEEDLYDAAKWYSLSARLVEYTSGQFEEEDSKQYLLDRFYYVFETTIDAYDRLYKKSGREQYADSILYYMEKSRAILLKEAMSRAAAIHRAGVPDSLVLAERHAYRQILALENKRYQILLNGNNDESAASLELAARIFDEKEKRRRLLNEIERLHPRFFANTYQQHTPRIQEVRQRLLRTDEAALQYFIGDDYLFVMVIGHKGCKTFKQEIPDSLATWITQMREAAYQYAISPDNKPPAVAVYAHAAQTLYQCLVAPLGNLPRRLLILPDGVLEYLPFAALLYEPAHIDDGFSRFPYLLNRHSIRYGQSLAVLMDYQPQRAKYRRVLALAPSFDRHETSMKSGSAQRSYRSHLRNSVPEVQFINKLFPARLLTGREASTASFEHHAGLYSVLHLATHAEANDEEGEFSFLAFGADSSSRMYVKNLYALNLPAELVVLSACETSLGELRRGEGLVSLARGFSYAGAGSLLTTLWRVSDRESAEMMNYYYQALSRRLPKDEALQEAQQQFRKIHELDSRANPFFWAAYISIGDAAPLSISRHKYPVWWILTAVVALYGAWRWRRKLRNR